MSKVDAGGAVVRIEYSAKAVSMVVWWAIHYVRRTEQKDISTSFWGLVATPSKVAKVMGALSPE